METNEFVLVSFMRIFARYIIHRMTFLDRSTTLATKNKSGERMGRPRYRKINLRFFGICPIIQTAADSLLLQVSYFR